MLVLPRVPGERRIIQGEDHAITMTVTGVERSLECGHRAVRRPC